MSSKNRKTLIAGNWKMHNTAKESVDLASAVRNGIKPGYVGEVLVAPTFTSLHSVAAALKGFPVLLAAQDLCWEEKGAFTGAVSPTQIKDAGCTHVIIGHSERRSIFGETDEIINKKLSTALKFGLVPVLCIGETLAERESQKTYRVLETQLSGALAGRTEDELSSLIVAYEPVWAIGTGKNATPEQAQDAHIFIRNLAGRLYSKNFAGGMRILYGGSVKADNVDSIMAQPDVDGALVGGASLKADGFLRIVHFQEVITK